MIAKCVAGFLGVNACFAVYDISVAFLHSRMDEVVFVHPPKADQLVRPGFSWRLRRVMNGTCRARRLWADKAKFVIHRAGCRVLTRSGIRLTSTCWLCGVTTSEPLVCAEALQRLTLVLSEKIESKELGIIGPNKCGCVKLMNRTIKYKPGVFQWHTDVKHARAVIELMGLDRETSKPAPTLGGKYCPGKQDSAGGRFRNAEDELQDEDRSAYRSAAGTLLHDALDRPDIQFCAGPCVSGLSSLEVRHLALLKHIAMDLVDNLGCAWQFPEQKAPTKIVAFTDAD